MLRLWWDPKNILPTKLTHGRRGGNVPFSTLSMFLRDHWQNAIRSGDKSVIIFWISPPFHIFAHFGPCATCPEPWQQDDLFRHCSNLPMHRRACFGADANSWIPAADQPLESSFGILQRRMDRPSRPSHSAPEPFPKEAVRDTLAPHCSKAPSCRRLPSCRACDPGSPSPLLQTSRIVFPHCELEERCLDLSDRCFLQVSNTCRDPPWVSKTWGVFPNHKGSSPFRRQSSVATAICSELVSLSSTPARLSCNETMSPSGVDWKTLLQLPLFLLLQRNGSLRTSRPRNRQEWDPPLSLVANPTCWPGRNSRTSRSRPDIVTALLLTLTAPPEQWVSLFAPLSPHRPPTMQESDQPSDEELEETSSKLLPPSSFWIWIGWIGTFSPPALNVEQSPSPLSTESSSHSVLTVSLSPGR